MTISFDDLVLRSEQSLTPPTAFVDAMYKLLLPAVLEAVRELLKSPDPHVKIPVGSPHSRWEMNYFGGDFWNADGEPEGISISKGVDEAVCASDITYKGEYLPVPIAEELAKAAAESDVNDLQALVGSLADAGVSLEGLEGLVRVCFVHRVQTL